MDNDQRGAGLRELMLAAEVPPTNVDVSRAIRAGRRQRRLRSAVVAAATALVVGGTAVTVHAALARSRPGVTPGRTATPSVAASDANGCVANWLPLPGNLNSIFIRDGDPSGRYLVGSTPEGTVVLWTDGRPAILPKVSGMAAGVNSDGVVVGYSETDSGDSGFGWVHRKGTVTRLATTREYPSADVFGINERGDVVGSLYGPDDALDTRHPAVWPAARPGTVYSLQTLPRSGTASDGCTAGQVIGKRAGTCKAARSRYCRRPARWSTAPRTAGRWMTARPARRLG